MAMATKRNNGTGTTPKHLAAIGILVACVVYVVSTATNRALDDGLLFSEERQRALLASGDEGNNGDPDGGAGPSMTLKGGLSLRLYSTAGDRTSSSSPASASSYGPGPELAGPTGQAFRFNGEARHLQRGGQAPVWYDMIDSPRRFRWNAAPYRWEKCPSGENMFLGDVGFVIHPADPLPPDDDASPAVGTTETVVTTTTTTTPMRRPKYLRFRMLEKDERECVWNYSKSCLGGGNFAMNFGKTAKDMLYPGDYSLRAGDNNERVRVVAYNTHKDCEIVIGGRGGSKDHVASASVVSPDAGGHPSSFDYLRRVVSETANPAGCEAWIRDREESGDLFAFNSDVATVHVDAPRVQITMQVRQNKVATGEECVHAGLNVWIADAAAGVLEGGSLGGVLGAERSAPSAAGSIRRVRVLSSREVEDHEVDGPFDSL